MNPFIGYDEQEFCTRDHNTPHFLSSLQTGAFEETSISGHTGWCPILLSSTASPGFAHGNRHKEHRTKLHGALVIDFTDTTKRNPIQEMTVTIPHQRKIAGVPIPKEVKGMPFRGQEFKVDFRNCLRAEIANGGHAILHITHKNRPHAPKATVVQGTVTQLASACLLSGNAIVMPFDPFMGDPLTSWIGQTAIWHAQVLAADPDGNGTTNEQEIRTFFDIPDDQISTRIRIKSSEAHTELGDECVKLMGKVQCSRGGSAKGIYSSRVMIKFHTQSE